MRGPNWKPKHARCIEACLELEQQTAPALEDVELLERAWACLMSRGSLDFTWGLHMFCFVLNAMQVCPMCVVMMCARLLTPACTHLPSMSTSSATCSDYVFSWWGSTNFRFVEFRTCRFTKPFVWYVPNVGSTKQLKQTLCLFNVLLKHVPHRVPIVRVIALSVTRPIDEWIYTCIANSINQPGQTWTEMKPPHTPGQDWNGNLQRVRLAS